MIAFFLAIWSPVVCSQITIDPFARVWDCEGVATYSPPPAMKPVVYLVDEAEWTDLPDVVGRNGFE